MPHPSDADDSETQSGRRVTPRGSGTTEAPAEALLDQQHRMRNMVAMLRSVFSRTVEASPSPEEAAAHYLGRFDTIARFLTASGIGEKASFDLETIVWDELHRYPVSGRDDVEVVGPSELLPYEVAQPIALALHELVTNSVKFGALDKPGQSHLAIKWWRDGEDLVLRWQETKVSVLRAAPIPCGFGRTFIEQGLPYQIGARTSFAIEPGGVVCTIRIQRPVDASALSNEGS